MARVAINGLGRIGRATLKIVMETPGLDLVAANDLASAGNIVYLLKYDSVYGRYDEPVIASDGTLAIGEHRLALLNERDPALLPWHAFGGEGSGAVVTGRPRLVSPADTRGCRQAGSQAQCRLPPRSRSGLRAPCRS